MLWGFGGLTGFTAVGIFFTRALVSTIIPYGFYLQDVCSKQLLASFLLAVFGMLIASGAHAIRFKSLGGSAISRSARAHVVAAVMNSFVTIFAVEAVGKVRFAVYEKEIGMAMVIAAVVISPAVAGFWLVKAGVARYEAGVD
jgi:hypothetical protein